MGEVAPQLATTFWKVAMPKGSDPEKAARSAAIEEANRFLRRGQGAGGIA
jgi:hypothetical protein